RVADLHSRGHGLTEQLVEREIGDRPGYRHAGKTGVHVRSHRNVLERALLAAVLVERIAAQHEREQAGGAGGVGVVVGNGEVVVVGGEDVDREVGDAGGGNAGDGRGAVSDGDRG